MNSKHVFKLLVAGEEFSQTVTPPNGKTAILFGYSTMGPGDGLAHGKLVWDGNVIDRWSGDKSVTFDGRQREKLAGDGVKALTVTLKNEGAASVNMAVTLWYALV